jgi:Zn finger protein HypA/HybF involved in hydrogenase expression
VRGKRRTKEAAEIKAPKEAPATLHCNKCGWNWHLRKRRLEIPGRALPVECPGCGKRTWNAPPDEHPETKAAHGAESEPSYSRLLRNGT